HGPTTEVTTCSSVTYTHILPSSDAILPCSFSYIHCDHRNLHSFPTTTLFRSRTRRCTAAPRPAPRRFRRWRAVHAGGGGSRHRRDRKSTRLNSSHVSISYAVFCLKKKK